MTRPRIVLEDPVFSVDGRSASQEQRTDGQDVAADGEGASTGTWLRDLYRRPELLAPPEALFEGIAYRGRHTLFAGREKLAGKSEMLGLICARAEGDAPILYLSFEEATADLVARMQRYGADPDRIYVVESVSKMVDVLDHVVEIEPELALIDSLASMLRRHLGVTDSENSDAWGDWVEHLTGISHDRDVGLVTVHHANKEKSRYRGHSSIAAAVDQIVHMHAGRHGDSERFFESIGRIRGVSVPRLVWTGTMYALASDGEDEFIRADVRNLLRESPGLSTRKICEAISRRRNDVQRVVNQMHGAGEIIDVSDSQARRAFVNADEGARFTETDVCS